MKLRIAIPGAFSRFNELVKLGIFQLADTFDLTVYDAAFDSKWAGGRITRLGKIVDLDMCMKLIEIYNRRNVGVFVTFSNYRIDDLHSAQENALLSAMNTSGLNGAIIANDALRNHIVTYYPNLRTSYSVSGFESVDLGPQVDAAFSLYNLVCPRYEWVFDPKFYQNFNITKCNIMLNDCCKAGCSLWRDHFHAIADANRLGLDDKARLKAIQECWIATKSCNPCTGWQHNGDVAMNLDKESMRRLIDIGYIGFKICGRDLPPDEFADEINTYLRWLCSLR